MSPSHENPANGTLFFCKYVTAAASRLNIFVTSPPPPAPPCSVTLNVTSCSHASAAPPPPAVVASSVAPSLPVWSRSMV